MEPTHQLELSHQPASRGLADALKQYGVLRSHSITQQAGIQIEEKKLRILEKRRLEEEQKRTCLDDRLRSLKELVDEKGDMAMHLDRDVNSASQMAIHLEMRSMSSCNREPPDQYEDVEERESSARRQIDRAISTMHKIVQSKEAKSRRLLTEAHEREGSKLKAYLERASSLVNMMKQLQATHASGGDISGVSHLLHEALTNHASEQPPLWELAEEELRGLTKQLHETTGASAALRFTYSRDVDMPAADAASSADDISSAPPSPALTPTGGGGAGL